MSGTRMQTVLKLVNPDEMLASLTITMTLADWKQFREQLSSSWPSSDLNREIREVIRKAEQTFEAEARS